MEFNRAAHGHWDGCNRLIMVEDEHTPRRGTDRLVVFVLHSIQSCSGSGRGRPLVNLV